MYFCIIIRSHPEIAPANGQKGQTNQTVTETTAPTMACGSGKLHLAICFKTYLAALSKLHQITPA